MKTSDFSFDLPGELIAQYPPPERGLSRLMLLSRATGGRRHAMVADLPELLAAPCFRGPGGETPLLVFNNSRVRKARLKARQLAAGSVSGEAEFLLLRRLDSCTWEVLVNRAKRRRPGSRYCFAAGVEGEIVEPPEGRELYDGGLRYLRFDSPVDDAWLDIHGHIPLPPYIRRDDGEADSERYQTVYADRAAGAALGPGASAAAPTAGLHFTEELLGKIRAAGIETVFVTLHVGLGTFLPVRAENIEEHRMHEEVYSIAEDTAERVNAAKAAGRKIIACGTTAVRTLESAWSGGGVKSGEGATSIFIYPGYRFRAADALFTNFHTPGSTLLMLVSAFAGRDFMLESYREAIKEGYRFFSYGDACLIL